LNWEKHVRVDPKLKRLAEVEHLIANPAKARAQLGWKPRVNFQQLARMMVDADIQLLKAHR
jgi:GDPmannose 4,6-dehydratase